jgi:putative transposase
MYEVSKSSPQNALRDLDIAFKNFFRGLKKKQKVGFPKFKSKKNTKQTFRIDGLNIKVEGNRIKLPKISWIRLKESDYIPTTKVKYLNATISKEIDRYYISIAVEEEVNIEDKQVEEIIGVDLGIKELATCSNGEVYSNSKFTNKYSSKLKREQRCLSRRQRDSKNKAKQRLVVAKVHRKIRNSRLDALHKTTSSITKTKCRIIVLEDLNVKGMMENHKLAKAIADSSFYELKRQITYKTFFYGGEVHLINRYFPSSKTCSNCGAIKEDLKLSDRTYNCVDCGFSLDRDLNAAINIERFYTGSSSEINAFGENVRLGSGLLEQSSLVELGIKPES